MHHNKRHVVFVLVLNTEIRVTMAFITSFKQLGCHENDPVVRKRIGQPVSKDKCLHHGNCCLHKDAEETKMSPLKL